MNPYLDVFTEALWSASIIPFSREPTFFAMQSFGGYDMQLAMAAAVAGAVLGLLINWCIGWFLFTQFKRQRIKVSEKGYAKAAHIFKRYLLFLLLLCWNPMLNYIPIIAAFLGVRLRLALPLMLLGTVGYYGYYLLY